MPATINYEMLPPHMREGAKLYVEQGIGQGHFLTAVLCNDLVKACSRADSINQREITTWASWLYNEAPAECWGSKEKVKTWIKHRGIQGLREGMI